MEDMRNANVWACAACKESKACAPAKHHYDECVERVTAAADSEDGAQEDCVEECKLRGGYSMRPRKHQEAVKHDHG